MAKNSSNAAANQAKQAAQRREKRIQEEAGRQLLAFGPVYVSGTGMKPDHFIEQAFSMAESFVAKCEARDAQVEAQFEPRPEPPVQSQSSPGPSDSDGAPQGTETQETSA